MPKARNRDVRDRIRREHDEVRALVGNATRELQRRIGSAASVAELLRSLERHLQAHYDDEEGSGGFFDDVCAQAPRFTERAQALKEQHVWLASALRELIDLAENPPSGDWRQELERKFHEFGRDFMQHEHKENELLLEAYGDDIGLAD